LSSSPRKTAKSLEAVKKGEQIKRWELKKTLERAKRSMTSAPAPATFAAFREPTVNAVLVLTHSTASSSPRLDTLIVSSNVSRSALGFVVEVEEGMTGIERARGLVCVSSGNLIVCSQKGG
jgi:hypothetical protein